MSSQINNRNLNNLWILANRDDGQTFDVNKRGLLIPNPNISASGADAIKVIKSLFFDLQKLESSVNNRAWVTIDDNNHFSDMVYSIGHVIQIKSRSLPPVIRTMNAEDTFISINNAQSVAVHSVTMHLDQCDLVPLSDSTPLREWNI